MRLSHCAAGHLDPSKHAPWHWSRRNCVAIELVLGRRSLFCCVGGTCGALCAKKWRWGSCELSPLLLPPLDSHGGPCHLFGIHIIDDGNAADHPGALSRAATCALARYCRWSCVMRHARDVDVGFCRAAGAAEGGFFFLSAGEWNSACKIVLYYYYY